MKNTIVNEVDEVQHLSFNSDNNGIAFSIIFTTQAGGTIKQTGYLSHNHIEDSDMVNNIIRFVRAKVKQEGYNVKY